MLRAVPLDMSVQVAQITLCVPVFFTWAVGGIETSFIFVPASASVSKLVEGSSQYSYLKCSKCAFGHVKLINQESLKAVGCLWAVGDAINGPLM